MKTSVTITGPGLCLTCNNSLGCHYHALRGPALFCERFNDAVDLSAPAVGWIAESVVRPAAAAVVTGLCGNCEHRQTCTHPHPEGGVWHCEDYE